MKRRLDKWEKDKDIQGRINYYRNKNPEYAELFFRDILKEFKDDDIILEIGRGTSFNLNFLKNKGFNKVIGVEANIGRVLYGVIDFDIPVYNCYFKYDTLDIVNDINIVFTYSALFLNDKQICKFLEKCNCRLFGCYENFNLVKFNVDKTLKKYGFEKIVDIEVGTKRGIRWFRKIGKG